MLRDFQSILVTINNHVVRFSFEYGIVPKDHKSEEEVKAIAVYLKCQDMCSDSHNWMKKRAGPSSQDKTI